MGVPGLFKELGQGSRVSLAAYNEDHSTRTNGRLRIAIDASIWSFQAQHGGRGGTSPALRTLYYRLVRLLSHNITPLFVFDGPHRPAIKRNKKTYAQFTPALTRTIKKLLKFFGFPHHTAPAEAEAECAALQAAGVVDAVLSEDVDTLMFGATCVMRSWSAEGNGSNKVPTHVTIYEADCIEAEAGLDSAGMVLIALMKGGDYLPEGVPGCGIKTAVEAARAGIGADLYKLTREGGVKLKEWRERLQMEVNTNKSKWFRRKSKLKIPEDFPNLQALELYTKPMISDPEKIERLRVAIDWNVEPDLGGLRELTREAFEWRGTMGAWKFVRGLAPALLASRCFDGDDGVGAIIERFHGTRKHMSTDLCGEVRVEYTPTNVVAIIKELEQEDDDRDADEQAGVLNDEEPVFEGDAKRGDYDPYKPERIWMLESNVRRGVQDFEERMATKGKKKATKKTTAPKKAPKTKKAQANTIDRYLATSKPAARNMSPRASVEPPEPQTVVKAKSPRKSKPRRTQIIDLESSPSPQVSPAPRRSIKKAVPSRRKTASPPPPSLKLWDLASPAPFEIPGDDDAPFAIPDYDDYDPVPYCGDDYNPAPFFDSSPPIIDEVKPSPFDSSPTPPNEIASIDTAMLNLKLSQDPESGTDFFTAASSPPTLGRNSIASDRNSRASSRRSSAAPPRRSSCVSITDLAQALADVSILPRSPSSRTPDPPEDLNIHIPSDFKSLNDLFTPSPAVSSPLRELQNPPSASMSFSYTHPAGISFLSYCSANTAATASSGISRYPASQYSSPGVSPTPCPPARRPEIKFTAHISPNVSLRRRRVKALEQAEKREGVSESERIMKAWRNSGADEYGGWRRRGRGMEGVEDLVVVGKEVVGKEKETRKETRNVVLRESLPGAFEVLEEGQEPRVGRRVWMDVEVVDLTGV